MELTSKEIPLGDETVKVVEQRQARIFRKLFGPEGIFASVDELSDQLTGLDSDDLFSALYELIGGHAYEVLEVFIPDLSERMPRWKFDGYGTAQAAERGEYDDKEDRSPTHPQVQSAFRTVIELNGLKWVGRLKAIAGMVDQELLKRVLNERLATWATGRLAESNGSESSKSLQSASGTSASTSSGPSDPTSAPAPASA